MIISENKKSKKVILAIISVFIIIALAFAYYFYMTKTKEAKPNQTNDTKNINKVDYSPPTNEQIESGSSIKKNSLDNTASTESNNAASTADITITVAQKSSDGKYFQVRSFANKVDSTAKCTLSLTKDNQTISKSVDVQTAASVSSCKGYDIDISDLSAGTWQMTIKYEGSLINGSTTKSIEI